MGDRQIAIVTGAGSGVGRQTSFLLAQAGYDVVLVGRTRSKLDATATNIDSTTLVEPVDLTDAAACRALIDRVVTKCGRIDALANVAGDAPNLPIEKITPDIWRRCIDTNLSSVIALTAAAWPIFTQQRRGIIVNISSKASLDPFPGFAIYAAAKVALNMFTRCTAAEGADIGLQAVTIAPGAIETPMLRAIFDEQTLPRDQTLDPVQVAELIRDCITARRAFEPGEVIALPSP